MFGLQGALDMTGNLFTLRGVAMAAADDGYFHACSRLVRLQRCRLLVVAFGKCMIREPATCFPNVRLPGWLFLLLAFVANLPAARHQPGIILFLQQHLDAVDFQELAILAANGSQSGSPQRDAGGGVPDADLYIL